jgi:hypothetical protein
MGWFKKPIKVKCYTVEEVGKLLDWLRHDTGLSQLNRQRYSVTAVMAMQYWENPTEVLYFEVEVPYYMFKKLKKKFIEDEVFDPILEQRAITQGILGRDL